MSIITPIFVIPISQRYYGLFDLDAGKKGRKRNTRRVSAGVSFSSPNPEFGLPMESALMLNCQIQRGVLAILVKVFD